MNDAADIGAIPPSARGPFGRFIDWLTLRHTSPELAADQLRDLSQYIALIYGIVAANMLFCFWGSWTTISPWMIGAILVPIAAIVTMRIRWWRAIPDRVPRGRGCDLRSLRLIILIMPIAGLLFSTLAILACSAWHSMALGSVVLFVVLCVIACMSCLRALPQAALLVACVVLLPHLFFAIRTGAHAELLTIGQLAILLAIVQVMLTISFRQFCALSESRRALMAERCAALRRADEQQRLARRDSLTSLCNRSHFFDIFDRMMAADDMPFAVAVIDLDRFKQVNDLHGHDAGDRLLVTLSDLVRAALPRGALAARLGGDEFVIMLRSTSAAAAQALGQDLREAFAQQARALYATPDPVSLSIGATLFDQPGTELSHWLKRADEALYASKRKGRNRMELVP